jgi:hypothetical protein
VVTRTTPMPACSLPLGAAVRPSAVPRFLVVVLFRRLLLGRAFVPVPMFLVVQLFPAPGLLVRHLPLKLLRLLTKDVRPGQRVYRQRTRRVGSIQGAGTANIEIACTSANS